MGNSDVASLPGAIPEPPQYPDYRPGTIVCRLPRNFVGVRVGVGVRDVVRP